MNAITKQFNWIEMQLKFYNVSCVHGGMVPVIQGNVCSPKTFLVFTCLTIVFQSFSHPSMPWAQPMSLSPTLPRQNSAPNAL